MEGISRLKIKISIAKRFREFAKKNAHKNSEALQVMLDFFERNNLSPFDSLVPSKTSLENLIKKRIDGLIAILKNIEKTQTKPSFVMLELLMGQQAIPLKKSEMESENTNTPIILKDPEQLELQIIQLKDALQASRKDLGYLLEKVEVKTNSFGPDYLKLDIPRAEFEQFKIALKHNP